MSNTALKSQTNVREVIINYHESLAKVIEKFICSECGKDFMQHHVLVQHVKDMHPLKSITGFKPISYKCNDCSEECSDIKSLQLHRKNLHKNNSLNIARSNMKLSCPECNRSYKYNRTLTRHIKAMHPSLKIGRMLKSYGFHCDKCTRQYSSKRNLLYHKRKDHGETIIDMNRYKRNCPLCGEILNLQFLQHFKVKHNIQMDVENLKFLTYDKFAEWKERMEKTTNSKFVSVRGVNKKQRDVTYYYGCHRSGRYVSQSRGLRRLKTQGTSKINAFCPASIKLTVSKTGTCYVYFLQTHVGHENELCHLWLTPTEREYLMKKIASEVPFDKILEEVRDPLSNNKFGKLQFIKRKDLFNIKSRYLQLANTEDYIFNDQLDKENGHDEDESENESVASFEELNETADVVLTSSVSERKEVFKKKFTEILDELQTYEESEIVKQFLNSLQSTLNVARTNIRHP